MVKGKAFHVMLCSLIIIFSNTFTAEAYDDNVTHPEITKKALPSSKLEAILKQNFGSQFPEGYASFVNGKAILDWLTKGSQDEDHPLGRASHHFHNPLLSWNQSQMSDSALPIIWSALTGWLPTYSNITWATGYTSQTVKADMSNAYNPYLDPPAPNNWDNARIYYYKALTRPTPSGTGSREEAFAQTFQAMGQVMHLLQDMAVPAHVRNDFTSHLTWGFLPAYWPYNPFEYYVKDNNNAIMTNLAAVGPDPNMPSHLTSFWDMDVYTGANPSISQNQGLAEYTNANFFSNYTIFTTDFPYPSKVNTTASIIEEVVAEDGQIDKRYYIYPTDQHYKVAAYSYFTSENISALEQWKYILDEQVYKDNAALLLPRAVGYSAALLDYFFRGTLAVALPDNGVYAITSPDGTFSTIRTKITNSTQNNEPMTNGTIQAIVMYKTVNSDPFQGVYVPSSTDISYSISQPQPIVDLPTSGGIELSFDVTPPVPLWATNVYLQIVYKGQLGNEADAIAVGFKDISEPTPVSIINNMDHICLNNVYYTAGSPEALAAQDANGNLISSYRDVNAHNLVNDYLMFSPTQRPRTGLSTNYNALFGSIPADRYGQVFILTDYRFIFANAATPQNLTGGNVIPWFGSGQWSVTGLKNQTDRINGTNYTYYPSMNSVRGIKFWTGVVYENWEYPSGSPCADAAVGAAQPNLTMAPAATIR